MDKLYNDLRIQAMDRYFKLLVSAGPITYAARSLQPWIKISLQSFNHPKISYYNPPPTMDHNWSNKLS